jgi:hypothetical protein
MEISRWILLRMRNVSDKLCRENRNTHYIFNNFFLKKSCCLWDNVEKYGRTTQATDGNIIRRLRFACWITKSTDTHSECVILTAFTLQQWLRQSASILRYSRPRVLLIYIFGRCLSETRHQCFPWSFNCFRKLQRWWVMVKCIGRNLFWYYVVLDLTFSWSESCQINYGNPEQHHRLGHQHFVSRPSEVVFCCCCYYSILYCMIWVWKESIKKNLWSYERKRWYMENQNKRWIR